MSVAKNHAQASLCRGACRSHVGREKPRAGVSVPVKVISVAKNHAQASLCLSKSCRLRKTTPDPSSGIYEDEDGGGPCSEADETAAPIHYIGPETHVVKSVVIVSPRLYRVEMEDGTGYDIGHNHAVQLRGFKEKLAEASA